MAYFIDLFSPETYEAFARSSRDVSGFRLRHKKMAERVSPSDVFVCYLTRLSRWFGLLEQDGGTFEVEFVPGEGATIAVLTLSQQDIRLMYAREILHVRALAEIESAD